MPLCFIEEIGAVGSFGVWKIEEDESTLCSLRSLPPDEKEHMVALKNPKKRLHRLAYRVLLQSMLKVEFSILYDQNGKPFLKNQSYNLSVSHSKDYAAVFISPTHPVGIDVEQINERMPALASRFLSPNELKTIDLQNIELLHLYWGGKECLYKMYSERKPLFEQHLSIEYVDIKTSNYTRAHIHMDDYKATHQLYFRKIGDYMLVYCY
ncbi:MAG: 4'-phosphopantetheinyl transferase superfamily protein [Bacteroidales bacterium]|jgi:phosphopantetheinyl transferase (holo-ACP synthase)|nr:4'-phosphopantetheinyl transferase superfamily protein [Bacteroidales bacterium]MDD4581423.1 4'-phosphopantetheinyl transferase superfamily protein [Bacteroidales bacterium]